MIGPIDFRHNRWPPWRRISVNTSRELALGLDRKARFYLSGAFKTPKKCESDPPSRKWKPRYRRDGTVILTAPMP